MSAVTSTLLRERFRGALLGVAIGDALGAPFEGGGIVPRARCEALVDRDQPLRYTDDTHMTLGVARSLVERAGFDGAHMAETFARDFEREPWRGYGPGPPRVFAALRGGVPWDRAAAVLFEGAGSFGNGAAMRVVPAALFGFPELERVAALARETARITHIHPVGIDGAVLQASAIGTLLGAAPDRAVDRDGLVATLAARVRTDEMREALERLRVLPRDAEPEEVVAWLGHGIEAHRSAPTALYCFLRHPESFVETVLFAVGLGVDADTIASMAGALSGAYLGEESLPRPWRERVEGAADLCALADALLGLRTTEETPAP